MHLDTRFKREWEILQKVVYVMDCRKEREKEGQGGQVEELDRSKITPRTISPTPS